jgi:hypothetical protein
MPATYCKAMGDDNEDCASLTDDMSVSSSSSSEAFTKNNTSRSGHGKSRPSIKDKKKKKSDDAGKRVESPTKSDIFDFGPPVLTRSNSFASKKKMKKGKKNDPLSSQSCHVSSSATKKKKKDTDDNVKTNIDIFEFGPPVLKRSSSFATKKKRHDPLSSQSCHVSSSSTKKTGKKSDLLGSQSSHGKKSSRHGKDSLSKSLHNGRSRSTSKGDMSSKDRFSSKNRKSKDNDLKKSKRKSKKKQEHPLSPQEAFKMLSLRRLPEYVPKEGELSDDELLACFLIDEEEEEEQGAGAEQPNDKKETATSMDIGYNDDFDDDGDSFGGDDDSFGCDEEDADFDTFPNKSSHAPSPDHEMSPPPTPREMKQNKKDDKGGDNDLGASRHGKKKAKDELSKSKHGKKKEKDELSKSKHGNKKEKDELSKSKHGNKKDKKDDELGKSKHGKKKGKREDALGKSNHGKTKDTKKSKKNDDDDSSVSSSSSSEMSKPKETGKRGGGKIRFRNSIQDYKKEDRPNIRKPMQPWELRAMLNIKAPTAASEPEESIYFRDDDGPAPSTNIATLHRRAELTLQYGKDPLSAGTTHERRTPSRALSMDRSRLATLQRSNSEDKLTRYLQQQFNIQLP